MSFEVVYHEAVVRDDIPKLSADVRERIKRTIEEKIITYPDVYGKPLRRSLKGYRKLRVGDWRVIFRVDGNTVEIFVIDHRSVVYKNVFRRLAFEP